MYSRRDITSVLIDNGACVGGKRNILELGTLKNKIDY